MPDTVEELDAYWDDALNDEGSGKGLLLQYPVSERMARVAFRLEGISTPWIVRHIGRAVLTASLDPRLLKRADIVQTKTDQRISNTFDFIMHQTYSRIPREWRVQAIPAYLALRRHWIALRAGLGKLSLKRVSERSI